MIYKAASGRTTQSAAEEATARLRVLVIDDDASLLRLYSQQIRRWPMQPDVTVMDNAIAALLAIGRTPPDLLIADLHMPGVDGFSVLRILQRTPELADVKLVAVSGMAAADIADRGGIAPGIELLPKPIPFARLQEIAGTLQPVRRQPLCNPHESTPP
jgi:CheY-like chemotaxis protein